MEIIDQVFRVKEMIIPLKLCDCRREMMRTFGSKYCWLVGT